MEQGRVDWFKLIYGAVKANNLEIFNLALLHGVPSHHEFSAGPPFYHKITLLKHVVENDFSAGLRSLLNTQYLYTRPALHEACRRQNVELINIFLTNSCNRSCDFAE